MSAFTITLVLDFIFLTVVKISMHVFKENNMSIGLIQTQDPKIGYTTNVLESIVEANKVSV